MIHPDAVEAGDLRRSAYDQRREAEEARYEAKADAERAADIASGHRCLALQTAMAVAGQECDHDVARIVRNATAFAAFLNGEPVPETQGTAQ